MKKFILIILLGLSAPVFSKSVYICDIKDSVQLTDAGMLEKTGFVRIVKDQIKQIVFDESTGRLSGIGNWTLQIVQHGNTSGNNLKARREFKGSMNFVVQTLSIQVWREKMPFTYYDDGDLYTGTCRKLG